MSLRRFAAQNERFRANFRHSETSKTVFLSSKSPSKLADSFSESLLEGRAKVTCVHSDCLRVRCPKELRISQDRDACTTAAPITRRLDLRK